MTTSAVPTTSTKEGHAHAEPADDGKTAGHAVARHGGRSEDTGTRSRNQRAEFPGSTLAAGRSAMEMAGEPRGSRLPPRILAVLTHCRLPPTARTARARIALRPRRRRPPPRTPHA